MSNCLCLWFNRFSDLSGVVHSQPLPFTAIFHFVIFPLQRKELKNFTCRWGGEVYMFLQYIIYRVTILVARFVMQHWTKKYREIFDMTALMVTQWKWDITSRITCSRWSPAAWRRTWRRRGSAQTRGWPGCASMLWTPSAQTSVETPHMINAVRICQITLGMVSLYPNLSVHKPTFTMFFILSFCLLE